MVNAFILLKIIKRREKRMQTRRAKKMLSLLVVLGLIFSLGISTYATDDFSVLTDGNESSTLSILKVEVVAGGAVQAGYRNGEDYDVSTYTVYKGDHPTLAVNGEDTGKYYTTARSASMTDPRIFTMELTVPADYYPGGIGTDDDQFDVSRLIWKYRGNTLAAGQAAAHVQSAIVRVGNPEVIISGDFIVVTQDIKFNAFVSANNSVADNRPYAPYYAMSSPGSQVNSIGNWDLEVFYGADTNIMASKVIRLNMNDSYIRYDEFDDFIREYLDEHPNGSTVYGAKGRYLTFVSHGVTTEGREIWAAVVSDSKASVDEYLGNTKTEMNNTPARLQAALKAGTASPKGVLFFSAIHGGEVVGPPAFWTIMERLLNEDTLDFTARGNLEGVDYERLLPTSVSDTNNGGRRALAGSVPVDLALNVDEFLDKFIVVLTFHGNPDGYSRAERISAYGYDMNRDASYFSQPETRAAAKAFSKWDPIYMVEFHGYYQNYIIDGTTPPYEPNFEVDLIEEYLLSLCDSMGMSIIGKSPHNRYVLPSRDVISGWDNGSTIYTPPMSMLFGSIGSTIEFPNATQDSVDAGIQGLLGLFKYCTDEWEGLMYNKLEFKRRAVENEDRIDKVDPLLTNIHPLIEGVRAQLAARGVNVPENLGVVGRPRVDDGIGGKLPFFPEYFIIPVDRDNQRSSGAAYEMLDILSSCGEVKLDVLNEPMVYGGVTYPKGTYIINMHQAARTFANTMLYDGYDASIYPALYDSIVISYPQLRGFDCIAVYKENYFKGKTTSVPAFAIPQSNFSAANEYIIVKNNSADAIRLVNRLLKDGKEVRMIDGYVKGAALGDFVVKKADANDKAKAAENKIFGSMSLFVEWSGYGSTPPANSKPVVQPVIGYTGAEVVQYYLDLYEFDRISRVTASSTSAGANVYMLSNASPSGALATAIAGGVPVVLVGSSNANNIIANAADRPVIGSRSGEALMRGTYSDKSLIVSNMEKQGTIYTMNGSNRYISALPAFMRPLATVGTGDDYFVAGRTYPLGSAADYKGKVMIAAGVYDNNGVSVPMTTIMNNVFSKAGSQLYYRIIANAMFAYSSGIDSFYDLNLVSAVPAASVTKLTGNQNDLTITITETFSNGSKNVITTTLKINNNAAGTYKVGGYEVYVDTKGNTQIRECKIVN